MPSPLLPKTLPPPPRLAAGDLVACDFDGTISVEDVGLAVITALGDPRAWDLEYQWRRGEIDSRQCLLGQWGLLNWPEDRLLAFFDSLPLDEGFRELWELTLARNARLLILSDGLDLYLDRMLSRLGYAACDGEAVLSTDFGSCVPRFANHAEYRQGRLVLSFPYSSEACPDCANCKLLHLTRLRPHFRRVIYIGDGHSDRCPARHATTVFAKSHLAQILAAEGVPYREFENLSQVAAMLSGADASGDFEILDHAADYAVRAWGRDLSSLISAAARGMLSFIADTEGLKPTQTLTLDVQAESVEYLVHHCLRALLYLVQDGQLPVTLSVSASDFPPSAQLEVGVVPIASARDRLRGEIKAVTYHNLAVRREADRLSIEVVFDT